MPDTFPTLTVEVTQTAQPESRDAIVLGLQEFNERHFGDAPWKSLDVYVRDAEGRIAGGLIGDYRLGWLSIHALWVTEERRGAGLGTRILNAAETAALENGCHDVILDTMSFQAPAFYEKRGYVRAGVVENYRAGTQRIVMQKRLGPR